MSDLVYLTLDRNSGTLAEKPVFTVFQPFDVEIPGNFTFCLFQTNNSVNVIPPEGKKQLSEEEMMSNMKGKFGSLRSYFHFV